MLTSPDREEKIRDKKEHSKREMYSNTLSEEVSPAKGRQSESLSWKERWPSVVRSERLSRDGRAGTEAKGNLSVACGASSPVRGA